MTTLPFACAAARIGRHATPVAPSAAAPLRTRLRDGVAVLVIATSVEKFYRHHAPRKSRSEIAKHDTVGGWPADVYLLADLRHQAAGAVWHLCHHALLG